MRLQSLMFRRSVSSVNVCLSEHLCWLITNMFLSIKMTDGMMQTPGFLSVGCLLTRDKAGEYYVVGVVSRPNEDRRKTDSFLNSVYVTNEIACQ